MSTTQMISRELLEKTITDWEATRDEIPFGLGEEGDNTLAALKFALTALDREPVAKVDKIGVCWYANDGISRKPAVGSPLYAAPPAPVPYPDTLPCLVLFEPGMRFGKGVKTRVMLNFLQRRAERYAELEAMTPEQRAEHDAGMNEMREMLGVPSLPAPGSTGATDFLPPPPMPTAIPVQATVNDITNGKPLIITLPDTSSKAFWSGSGKSEVFHPETYKRWVKEAIERDCCIARIEVRVK